MRFGHGLKCLRRHDDSNPYKNTQRRFERDKSKNHGHCADQAQQPDDDTINHRVADSRPDSLPGRVANIDSRGKRAPKEGGQERPDTIG